ncbi:MAG: 6-phosphofructokinase [Sphingomonadales bacterium]|nr:6-phosphofructokinase [Sphingomonadales bacterium]
MSTQLKKVAFLTSGGDSPGMNACIRALVRSGIHYSFEMWGVVRGYDGLIQGDYQKMDLRSVSNIINRGGTILKSARSEEFRTEEGMEKAYQQLRQRGIDALVVIGGDGSFRGAFHFSNRYDIKVIGLPGTIDNDLNGTDFTIGYDTATNTVVDCIDKIRDTADAHNRLFFIEVMGRDAGYIALYAGIAAGCEDILIPETKTSIDELVENLKKGRLRNKTSGLVIVAEGDEEGGAYEIARKVQEQFDGYEMKVTILGHIQRGGSPSCFDRVLASRLGVAAIEGLMEGKNQMMAGLINNQVVFTPLTQAAKISSVLDHDLFRISKILSI